MKTMRWVILGVLLLAPAGIGLLAQVSSPGGKPGDPAGDLAPLPDPKQVGGEDGSVVQVANLVYAKTKSSKCFSDHFLIRAEQESSLSTSRRFHVVKADSEEIFQYPFVIITGEGAFELAQQERENLKKYCENGGFLLASAGCSSQDWDKSFRREAKQMWPEAELQSLPMSHPVFHTVYDIDSVKTKHGSPNPLEGISLNGKLVLIHSRDGLNDTAHTQGCCCCGGDEIINAEQVNVNILAYAVSF